MKKIFILLLLALTIKLNAQTSLNPYAYSNGYWADGKMHSVIIPYIDTLHLNNKTAVQVVKETSEHGNFGVFLLNKSINKSVDSSLLGFFDSTVINAYKKIDDTTFEIDIYNLSLNIIIAYNGNTNWQMASEGDNGMKGFAGTGTATSIEGPSYMGLGIKNIEYVLGNERLRYNHVVSFNPLGNYHIEFYLPKRIKIIIKSILPKPVLTNVFTEDWAINAKKNNPASDYGTCISCLSYMQVNINNALSQNKHALVFSFAHFADVLRMNEMDLVQYKLDTASEWSLTSLSKTPSILLENLSFGKHTLYVRYPSEDAEILKINWEITPP